ncbi:MAG: TraM recognition domain-containing protein [Pseudonocardiaceae bacterium]|nr:TraM recognition domain-containing protein [Pseudonocardiaceae bacterium]
MATSRRGSDPARLHRRRDRRVGRPFPHRASGRRGMRRGHQRRSWLPRMALTGLVAGLLGWLMHRMPPETPARIYWPWLAIAGGALLLGSAVVGWNRYIASSGLVGRWSRRSRRNQGVASAWAILRVASRWAVRRKAAVLRPSLGDAHWWCRLLMPTRELATPLARVGLLRVWSPIEDVTLRIGGPRVGKTGELACRILDAPGAVIATSTRTDLISLTRACRERLGPVGVFNPSGVGDLESTITFDPLSGCEHPVTATARAADLLSGVSSPGRDGEREYWAGQARRALASLLHAAALGDASMRDVQAWVADPDTAAVEVQRFLRRSPEPAFESDALQFLSTNERTRSSICASIMPALGWLMDSTAAAAADKGDFDVEQLLENRGTVFMLGAEDTQTAPLVTALTGHIARQARRLASQQPGGRLDPPLTLALDEAALICPIPLDSWTADMGGRGVTIHIAAQSRAQLRQRWGDTGAAAILNNAATLLVYGGTRDVDDLNAYSALTGERDEEVPSWDPHGDLHTTSIRRVPVLSAAQIAQLPARHVVIIRRGMPPAIGRVRMAWTRSDVKAAARATSRAARAERFELARERAAWWVTAAADELAATQPRLAPLAARIHTAAQLSRPVRFVIAERGSQPKRGR